MKYGLKQQMLDDILKCIDTHANIEEAILYGSRAMGNYRLGSDIDLSLKEDTLSIEDIFAIENCLDNLLLPYKFDLSLFKQIENPELLDHIKRVGVVLYSRNEKM